MSNDKGSISGKISEESIAVDKVRQEWREIPEAERIETVKQYLAERSD